MQIINARIHTMAGPIIEHGFITFSNGKITALDKMANFIDDGSGSFDAAGRGAYPGFIDAHCHLGVFGDSLGFEGEDANEATDPVSPHLRALDGINALDRCFAEALLGGVTTVHTGPGSANPISGTSVIMKTHGVCVDEMALLAPASMKFALGENPKTVYHGKNQAPETRMATAALIRDSLIKAKRYLEDIQKAADDEEIDRPEYDPKLEALIPVLKGELPAHFHAHRADDIFTALRITSEFNLRSVLVHCTEGHLIADRVAAQGGRAFVGPNLCDRSKPELRNLHIAGAGILHRAGVQIAIVTDHPVIPIQYLPLCAALAVKGGLDREEALRALTVYPAEMLGISHKVGSLKVGLDADVVLWDADPLEVQSTPVAVFVNGERAV